MVLKKQSVEIIQEDRFYINTCRIESKRVIKSSKEMNFNIFIIETD